MENRGEGVESIRNVELPSQSLPNSDSGEEVLETREIGGSNHGDGEDSYLDISGDRGHLLGWASAPSQEGGVLTRAMARQAGLIHPRGNEEAASADMVSTPLGHNVEVHMSPEGVSLWAEMIQEQQEALLAGREQLEIMATEADAVRSRYDEECSRMTLLKEEARKVDSGLMDVQRRSVEAMADLQKLETAKARTIQETEAIEESTASTARCRWLESELDTVRQGSKKALSKAEGRLESMLKEKNCIESEFRNCVAANKDFVQYGSKLRSELDRLVADHSEQVASQQTQFGTELERVRREHSRILEQREADEGARLKDAEKVRHRLEGNVRRQKEETEARILEYQEEANRVEMTRLEGDERRWKEISERRKTLDASQEIELYRLKQLNQHLIQQSEVDRQSDTRRVAAEVREEHRQRAVLQEEADLAVALSRSKHDARVQELRRERSERPHVVAFSVGLDEGRVELRSLIDLSQSRDLTSSEYARYEELSSYIARSERKAKAEADVEAMAARVEQLTSQYEAQFATQRQPAGGSSRRTGNETDEVGSLMSSDLNVG